jgi:Glycosyl hydrolase catalytic core
MKRPHMSRLSAAIITVTLAVVVSGCGTSVRPADPPYSAPPLSSTPSPHSRGLREPTPTPTRVFRRHPTAITRRPTHQSNHRLRHRSGRGSTNNRRHRWTRHSTQPRHRSSKPVPHHLVPPLHFTGKTFPIGDMFGVGSYAATRFPGLTRPALSRARRTGIDWVREELTANRLHLSTNSRYQWWRTDGVINEERHLGFHILGLLDYNNTFGSHPNSFMPHWALSRYIHDFVRYVRAIVTRYRHSIHAWQIWNEPDRNDFWGPKANPRDYARLLAASYRAIKQISPSATVVMGGPAGTDPHPLRFIWQVVHAGGRFDVLSVQPYRDVPDMQLLNEVRGLRGYHKPIWFTEMGWAGDQSCSSTCGFVNSQASRLARLYAVAVLGRVQRVFWYDLRDDGTGPGFEDHFGLLETDLAAKPSYIAIELSHFYLNQAEFLGVDNLESGLFAFELRKHGERYDVLWNNRLDVYGLDIPWAGRAPARVLDWAGNQVANSRGGEVRVVVPPRSILYIVPSSFSSAISSPAAVQIGAYRIHFPPLRRAEQPSRRPPRLNHRHPPHRRKPHKHRPRPRPTARPSQSSPTPKPKPKPTARPKPTTKPKPKPTVKPTPKPTAKPTPKPTTKPTPKPTVKPTPKPTTKPMPKPTPKPTAKLSPAATKRATPTPTAVRRATATPKATGLGIAAGHSNLIGDLQVGGGELSRQ